MFDQAISKLSSSGLHILSLKKSTRQLSILIYHQVMEYPDPYRPGEVDQESFRWQMKLLSQNFNVLPLSSAINQISNGDLPTNALSITFDDGYANNHDIALPILQEYGLCATFFIATSFLNGGKMWNDHIIDAISNVKVKAIEIPEFNIGILNTDNIDQRISAINSILQKVKHTSHEDRNKFSNDIYEKYAIKDISPMMTDQQIINLKKSNMEIGGHTMTHPILANLSLEEAYKEIKEGKDYLENLLDSSVNLFAYPNGKQKTDYNQKTIDAVKKAGFTSAVSTEWGVSNKDTDTFELKRFTPWDDSPAKFSVRLAKNYFSY